MAQSTIAVIDGNSLLHRAFHALPPTMTAPDGRPTNAVYGFVSMMLKMVGDLDPDGVVVAFDRGKPAFRTEVLARYKAHRPPTADELKVQFPIVKQVLEALAVPIVEAEGWEADDLLGTLAEQGKAAGMRVLLITGDRDALQLVDDSVGVVSTLKGITDIVVYDRAGVVAKTGVAPDQIADYLGLKGDTSDNIPGVPGVGEKTAARLIAEHGTLEAVLAAAPVIPGKLGENLREHAEQALASRLVATIRRDVPVDVDVTTARWGEWRAEDVARVFGELRFTSLLDRLVTSAVREAPRTDAAAAIGGAWPILDGAAARERMEAWGAATSGWTGTAPDEGGGDSLFSETRGLALARDGEAAIIAEDAAGAFGRMLATGRVAAGDVKAVASALGTDPEAVDPARVFDCGIAAYLLESGRSSYDLRGLVADHLGTLVLEGGSVAAAEAQAAAELTPVLERKLVDDGSFDVFRRIEMPLVPVLLRMERIGVGIDTSVLSRLSAETAEGIERLRGEILADAGCEFTIDSPKQLGEVLFEKLGLPRGKRTKTGWSTDASVLGDLAEAYPIAGKVLGYRELTKLKSTYIDALPRMLGDDGRLHTTFNQTVAATGRLSSSNPNLQNIPVRTELGRRIRAAFVPARAGDVMVSADYSQIELRILAHLSGDPGLIEAFTSGTDFHAATGSRVFGVPIADLTPEHRRRAKAVNFGIVYGISAHGLSDSLKIERADAQSMIDRYYAAYPRVREFLDETVTAAHRDGYAITMYGRKRRIPELGSSNYNLRSFGERTAMNHPMQGTAADIMKLAMIEVDRRLRDEGCRSSMLLQVHDELVFEAPEDEVERLSQMAREAMCAVAELAVPLVADVGFGPDWASAK